MGSLCSVAVDARARPTDLNDSLVVVLEVYDVDVLAGLELK